ncbi:putative lipoprotein [Cellvibrio japonicus]|uniref:Putative lipoprotein n=1 Tax=Cellvibrio japonicus (strain Ueda107) TaxID=498211 RepID=B3PES9_CELJU|nr:putative lipoprotein [Cellvibrio japonicus]ACE83446.1 putative lipoprotein [Cellvibrio japonicus Ueda107]QEI12178.1 hypothetical protein FY117_08045 [Cellvibrio japonicus]QEI15752.1 hypothetical protein FY116_08050 [Cellvibrio japonicus]QEI19330.1 hypothetical protein FY115_08045 [Cellvibrio japonicus]
MSMRLMAIFLSLVVVACGGSGGASSGSSSQASSTGSQSSSSVSGPLTLEGRVTFDHVPFTKPLPTGLDYAATEIRPGRGLVVELLNSNNQVIASTLTDMEGYYLFQVPARQSLRVRVKAQLQSSGNPSWDISVRDNTSSNALYVLDGGLASTGTTDSTRNLHAASGWTDSAYGNTRAAAPFAILDAVYTGVQRFIEVGFDGDFAPLNLYWSVKNLPVEGDLTLGEIGTSFYGGPDKTGVSSIYILGDENNDTDEYDTHVILHEWGHYIEATLSRTDTLGGDHPEASGLDMRVAMSEGFATGLAAILLDNPRYADSSGVRQGQSYNVDVSRTNNSPKGWFAEASVYSILYNYYVSGSSKIARDFSDIVAAITAPELIDNDAFISIYVFTNQLKKQAPAHSPLLSQLLTGQSIFGTGDYGDGEVNAGGNLNNVPVYKLLLTDGSSVELCSTNGYGTYNRLGNAQYARFTIHNTGNYRFSAQKSAQTMGVTDPDFYIYHQGVLLAVAESAVPNRESLAVSLSPGNYVMELVEAENLYGNQGFGTACFNLSLLPD